LHSFDVETQCRADFIDAFPVELADHSCFAWKPHEQKQHLATPSGETTCIVEANHENTHLALFLSHLRKNERPLEREQGEKLVDCYLLKNC
jgi:hypothetical protein